MKLAAGSIAVHQVDQLTDWQMCATAPGGEAREWSAGASTAAASLRDAGTWSLDSPARRFDAEDWWWRTRISATAEPGEELALSFEGLATVAEVWLDDQPLLQSDNMFRAYEARIARGGELKIRFRALDSLLGGKRPRPRWRVPMVENQQLRWFRTTLLGRTPGWSPPVATVGPWRPVRVIKRRGIAIEDLSLSTSLAGHVKIAFRARSLGAPLDSAHLSVSRNGVEHRATLAKTGEGFSGTLEMPSVEAWWPHTHGVPALYAARLSLGEIDVDLGKIGFREIVRDGDFSLAVNGVSIFCRGACWTPVDVVTLSASRGDLFAALQQVRGAGMNMLRVGGTMVYESDDFYELADELGILIWQDFMFANFDYPEDDAFVANASEEARQQLARLSSHPSLTVWCGNSEVEQQAAMFGASRDRWSPKLFHQVLPSLAQQLAPAIPYWPSSAHGGAFPHEAGRGTASYYGVGAYLRPLEDARRAEVRFASECLAFANVPDKTTTKVHSPAWKARTPRDLGAGWDFDDVRDHYVARLFGVDPQALRYADHDRHLALGRVAVGEVMAQVFGEWRRQRSTCRGGLVWFLRDLWAGAGWGVVDAAGEPKSAWWYLKRSLASTAVHISDEGGNGLWVHLHHDGARTSGELEIELFRDGEVNVGNARRAVEFPSEIAAASLFDGFSDLSYAYRFGPPGCDLVVATLHTAQTSVKAFHFPLGLPNRRELDLGLTAELRGEELTVKTRRFAQSIYIDGDADDNYFHLAPGATRRLGLRSGVTLQPLNCLAATKIVRL